MQTMKNLASYWHRLRRHPLAWNLVLIAALVLALALAAHLFMQFGTRHGARRIVPDLAGVKFDDARRLAGSKSLKLHINDSLFVPAYEGGIILDQLPEAGVEVKPGRTIYVTINSYRQKMVTIPYVAGRSLRQAKNMLDIAGLGIDEIVYRPDMATNYVLEEAFDGRRITEGSKLEAEMGSGVTLYVGVEADADPAVVPQVVGLSLKEAKGRLWEQGLNIGKVTFDEGINLLNQKDARVYEQRPSAERDVAWGTSVELRLTLDDEKLEAQRKAAQQTARREAAERLQREQARADSLARAELDRLAELPAGADDGASEGDEFFD